MSLPTAFSVLAAPEVQRRLLEKEKARLLGEKARVERHYGAKLEQLERQFWHMLRESGVDKEQKHPSDVEHLAMLYANLSSTRLADDQENEDTAGAGAAMVLKKLHADYMAAHLDWLKTWKAAAYARLSCGHKLAAALMMTTAPDDDVRAPWDAWSLYVPNDLLVAYFDPGPTLDRLERHPSEDDRVFALPPCAPEFPGAMRVETARIWCRGTEPYALVERFPKGCMALKCARATKEGKRAAATWTCIRNYVRGVCLMLEREHTDSIRTGPWGPKAGGGKKRMGKEPVGNEYQVSSPVTIDLREAVREYLSGNRGTGHSPKVQFLVRGHWRNQACGPHRADRRRKWIEPFWKGPEETRILLRGYAVKAESPP